jgi:hypothetical protein
MTITTPVCSEQRNEPDPNRYREVVAKQPQQVDATGQREGNGEQHVRRFQRRAIGEIEQHENHKHDDGHDHHESPTCALLVFPPSTPVDVVTRGERHVSRDNGARLADESTNIASLHVEQHGRDEQAVLG